MAEYDETRVFEDGVTRERRIGYADVAGLDLIEIEGEIWEVSGFTDDGRASLFLFSDRDLAGALRRRMRIKTTDLRARIADEGLVCWTFRREICITIGLDSYLMRD